MWNAKMLSEFQKSDEGDVEYHLRWAMMEVTKTVPCLSFEHVHDIYKGEHDYEITLNKDYIFNNIENININDYTKKFLNEKLYIKHNSCKAIEDGLIVTASYHTRMDTCNIPEVLETRYYEPVLNKAMSLMYASAIYKDMTKVKLYNDFYTQSLKQANSDRVERGFTFFKSRLTDKDKL